MQIRYVAYATMTFSPIEKVHIHTHVLYDMFLHFQRTWFKKTVSSSEFGGGGGGGGKLNKMKWNRKYIGCKWYTTIQLYTHMHNIYPIICMWYTNHMVFVWFGFLSFHYSCTINDTTINGFKQQKWQQPDHDQPHHYSIIIINNNNFNIAIEK